MAYKFQTGQFNASGAVDILDDLQNTPDGKLKGAGISAKTLSLSGSSAAEMKINGTDGTTLSDVSSDVGLVIRGDANNSGAEQFMINELVNGENVGVSMQFGSGSNTNAVHFKKTDNSDGIYGLEVRNASGDVKFKANHAAGKGMVSGSGAFQFGGDLDVKGNLTVAGNLTINGTNISLRSNDVKVSANTANIANQLSADNDLRGVARLDSHPSGDQLQIRFENQAHSLDGVAVKRLKFYDEGLNQDAQVVATKFFGDGSNLAGINAQSFKYSVGSKSDGDDLAAATINYFTNTNGGVSGTLPAASTGAVVYVKAFDNATSTTNYLEILRNGSDTIEGGTSAIRIQSPFGAVKLIASGSNWHLS